MEKRIKRRKKRAHQIKMLANQLKVPSFQARKKEKISIQLGIL